MAVGKLSGDPTTQDHKYLFTHQILQVLQIRTSSQSKYTGTSKTAYKL